MSENRRLSTRNRGEPPLKKRALTPPPPAAAPAPPPPPTEPTLGGLPVKLRDGRPLPTLSERQRLDLSTTAYQSISERSLHLTPLPWRSSLTCSSGVLAASIERSRQKWLVDGIFERYWTKPSKKNNMVNALNPAKETMTRLGNCSITIDPHVFEATLYGVKDVTVTYAPAPLQSPSLSTPQYNPFTPYNTYTSPLNNTPSSVAHPPYQPQQHSHPSQPSLPPFREAFGPFGPQGPPPIYRAPIPNPATAPAAKPPDLSRSGSTHKSASQGENGEPKPDPVIQMLATRAASNQALKTLMKVVASGQASPDQLKEFQSHIDELNSILKSRGSPPPPFGQRSADVAPHSRAEQVSHPAHQTTPFSVPWGPGGPTPTHPQPYQGQTPIKVEPSSKIYPMTASPIPTKAHDRNKSDIDGIVFDLGGTGDRFSFPRFSILEYLYGGTQVIVSFLIIRRGSTAASGKYRGTMSYYQPVTIRLTCPNPKVLEPLARVVAPPDEARRYMDDYFDRLNPAEAVYLATRLPRIMDVEDVETQETSILPDIRPLRPIYPPPNSIMPLAA